MLRRALKFFRWRSNCCVENELCLALAMYRNSCLDVDVLADPRYEARSEWSREQRGPGIQHKQDMGVLPAVCFVTNRLSTSPTSSVARHPLRYRATKAIGSHEGRYRYLTIGASSRSFLRRRGSVDTHGVVKDLVPRKWQGKSCRLVQIRGSVLTSLPPARILLRANM
jgi:hypothetical protein